MAAGFIGRIDAHRRRRAAAGAHPLGSGEEVDRPALSSSLRELGDDGRRGRLLARLAGERAATLTSLSTLTGPLAVEYLERISRPLAALTLEGGVRLTALGYAAHLVIEDRGTELGVAQVPVLGTLPPLRRGRPPQDLSTRVVRATRRGFEAVRAVPEPVWDALVLVVTAGSHAERGLGDDGSPRPPLDPSVVDALLRFGWVLRQVDLHYALQPETV